MAQHKPSRPLGQHLTVLVFGAIALIYLINPTAGIIELVPDNIPIIGNLDEAAATLVILNALRFYGVDVFRLFGMERGDRVVEAPIVDEPDRSEGEG